jgi:Na+-transporting NADH:ubiquinone oxidoreductase subunit A
VRIRVKDGLDIPISGAPEQSIHPGPPVDHVALCGQDYVGLKPGLLVAAGDRVGLGQALFIDKRDPAVNYTAPGAGTIVAVNRGARRSLDSVVIRLEESGSSEPVFESFTDDELMRLKRGKVVSQLLESGLWPAFRTRPFSRVPASDSEARSIFVTAIDTQPLAADPRFVIAPQYKAFLTGLRVLSRLTDGTVWLCTGPGRDIPEPEIEAVRRVQFEGPHPAGLPGTHIHFLDPAGTGRTVWHIGYQDVIAFGRLFATGAIPTGRVVAIAGEPVSHPRLIRTRLGASIADITAGEFDDAEPCRVVSGSLLTGRTATAGNAFLGRYHNQVSLIREGGSRRLFGWLGVVSRRYTASGTFLKKTGHRRKFVFHTARNGRFCGMLPMRVFEKVTPLDILPSVLFRALMVKDTDQAQALGSLELDEEDLALCSFVCPAKYDYGAVLRANLGQIEREG